MMSYILFLPLFLESYFLMELKLSTGREVAPLEMLGIPVADIQELRTKVVPSLFYHLQRR